MTKDNLRPSKSVEDFLKAVYVLQQQAERVSTNALAETLQISASSVTDMARRMVETNLVDYKRYYGVHLTAEGEQIALKVIRRHRLIELYLVEELGYGLHEVHDDAEGLEHAVSDRFIDAIVKKLNDPQFDPHGDPIPSADGIIERRNLISLTELPDNAPALVRRLISEDTTMLQHILERGFKIDGRVKITSRDPFNGPLTVLVDGNTLIIGHSAANCILVQETYKKV